MSVCLEGQVDPFQPPLPFLLDYLLSEFNRIPERSYGCLNTTRSAISTIAYIDHLPAGQHPLVCRFMKAIFQVRPSLSRSRITWDPDMVLSHIADLGPNEDLSTIQLSRKLTVLMLLVSGQRGQTLHALDIRNMSVSPSRISFRIGDLLKTSRPGVHLSELTFHAYVPNRLLCVCTTIMCYIERTSEVRGTETKFFLISKPPFTAASRDTLRRWTKDLLAAAGVDLTIFYPHSTRSAASSKAALTLPLSTVISAVGWSAESSFARFYNKPLGSPALFAAAVLPSAC